MCVCVICAQVSLLINVSRLKAKQLADRVGRWIMKYACCMSKYNNIVNRLMPERAMCGFEACNSTAQFDTTRRSEYVTQTDILT